MAVGIWAMIESHDQGMRGHLHQTYYVLESSLKQLASLIVTRMIHP